MQLDLPGALAAVTGLGALVFGIQNAAGDGWTSPKTLGALTVSAVLLAAFGFIERRVAAAVGAAAHLADQALGLLRLV